MSVQAQTIPYSSTWKLTLSSCGQLYRLGAQDEETLAPLGFHRGFVRTEIAQWSGEVMAFDQVDHVSVGSENSPVLGISRGHSSQAMKQELPGNNTLHFVQLETAYMAMWLASRQQLAAWIKTEEWAS